MSRTRSGPRLAAVACILVGAGAAQAHFQELIPSTDVVTAATGNRLELALTFTHPMARGPVMDMGEPVRFGVLGPGGREDLRAALRPVVLEGRRAYGVAYRVREPGDYLFFLEPAPYWEPGEGVMIRHFTKVVVDAYGAGEGWDRPLGLPVEILPLTRPYGLWTGNLLRAVVTRGGRPVPHAEVEVEWRNDGSVTPPSDPYLTQVVKADAAGVFAYAMPRAGWWGFAALLQGDQPLRNPAGEEVPVEEGGVIWVRVRDMR